MSNQKPAKKRNAAKAKKPKNEVTGCPSSAVNSGRERVVTPCIGTGTGLDKLAQNEEESSSPTA